VEEVVGSVNKLESMANRGAVENQGPTRAAEDAWCGGKSPHLPFLPGGLDEQEPSGYASLEGSYGGYKHGSESEWT